MYDDPNITKALCDVGIAGGSCSGKGYLCHHLHAQLTSTKCVVLPMDCYYRDISHLPLDERHAGNFDHPDAFDYSLFHEHLKLLITGRVISMPCYDFHTHTRSISKEKIHAQGKVVLVEGIFALYWPEISQLFDLKIFVDLDSEICLKRRIKRDVRERGRSHESVKRQYHETVLPMYDTHIAPTQQHADLTILVDSPVGESVSRVLQFIGAKKS